MAWASGHLFLSVRPHGTAMSNSPCSLAVFAIASMTALPVPHLRHLSVILSVTTTFGLNMVILFAAWTVASSRALLAFELYAPGGHPIRSLHAETGSAAARPS